MSGRWGVAAMSEPTYIHGMSEAEQARLANLNRFTNPAFLDFLQLPDDAVVLEVGSGLGILANEVAARVPRGEVVGIEHAPEQLAKAQALRPNVRFLQGDAHDLPFTEGSFDAVYCRYVLEHVADPQQVVREMHRVLKPGGAACAQENDVAALTWDPDCPAADALVRALVALQSELGGDALMGRRLFRLFRQAGFHDVALSIQPEIHTAGSPGFEPWLVNAIGVFDGAAPLLHEHGLATPADVDACCQELRALVQRDDASCLFYWNRVRGVK